MLAALASSNLGRAAARAGDCGAAVRTLEDALRDFDEIRAGSFVLETRARLAECAVLSRSPERALLLADEALTEIELTESGAPLRALLHRLRGYALDQLDDADGAAEALRYSITIAREAEETYEAALTLQAIARIQDDADAAAESRALLARLGVVSTPY
jgi:Flp pilus assembly protein TadD